jgi:signal transduction histidine kinase
VKIDVESEATQRSVLDALEACYPMLRGTIRDHISQQRRPFLRFFTCETDLFHESPDAPLPDTVASGAEPSSSSGRLPAVRRQHRCDFMHHRKAMARTIDLVILEVLTTPSQGRKHKGSILVIDDEPASLKLLFTILTEDGYAVHERQLDLVSQLRFVKDTLPDLVLVDVRKPGMDGYQVCASLKNDPATRAIPVIFISSIDRSINQAKALVSGAVDYVTDPFDAEEVLWRIETHVSLRRLRENLESVARNHGSQPVERNEDLERAFQQIHVLTQVTGRKHAEEKVRQAERELKRSEAFLAEGQRVSSTGSFSWKVATDEITWSEQLYRIYELEIGVPVTRELIRTRVHPEDVSLIEKMKMVDQARDGGNEFEWQYRLMMPDHSIKYMHAVAHAVRDRDGQLEYIAAVQDVTARREAEEALAKARSELAKVARVTSLGVLTASIAHEVNQPLSGIITNASTCLRMLDADPPNVDGARETARRTIRDGNRASDVITRLRALFRKEEFTLELLDLNDVTRAVIALSLSDLQRNRVALRSELAEDLPTITGDRIQLQQVILNLLRNASDAMADVEDRPRQLLIRTEREDGGRVRVSVRDAGVGIDAQSINKLFDAFYTTKSDGMGIGLSVSSSIIERHHGRLWAEPNDGPGATFSFSIPSGRERVTDAAPAMRHS